MKDLFNKAVSLGLGLAVASKEQVEKLVEEMVRKGEMSRADSSAFVEELLQKGKEAQRKVDTMVRERVAEITGSKHYATKEEIARLERRLDELERRLGIDAAPPAADDASVDAAGADGEGGQQPGGGASMNGGW
ncbi:MAG: hypothetical protein J7639_06610 [Paenibacillaceae bacterium]|nr:hypothetical protein [Paenibacillaceae bacterium]